jgi:hypothetical protein
MCPGQGAITRRNKGEKEGGEIQNWLPNWPKLKDREGLWSSSNTLLFLQPKESSISKAYYYTFIAIAYRIPISYMQKGSTYCRRCGK